MNPGSITDDEIPVWPDLKMKIHPADALATKNSVVTTRRVSIPTSIFHEGETKKKATEKTS